jgi:glucokinase
MPAPFDYGNGICLIEEQAKFNSLYKVNIKEELSARIGIPDTQIKFVNDAEAFLHGESAFGAGIHEESLLGITLDPV